MLIGSFMINYYIAKIVVIYKWQKYRTSML